MTSPAFDHLSPAFPGRAPWGTASRLRAWQQAALDQYREANAQDFLCVATPGAGKTTFALRIAHDLLSSHAVKQVLVVAPTEHLKVQWAEAAAKVGIQLDPGLSGARRGRSRHYDGVVVTYAGVGLRPYAYRALATGTPTLVILDEIHHAGDTKSWGAAVGEAFSDASRRLCLTGTPFRSDNTQIPFIDYQPGRDGTLVSRPDFSYGYAEALADHVVRPVVFMNYGGDMTWRTKAGDQYTAELGSALPKDVTAQAWRTALDPHGDWISAVLSAADRRLSQVRRHLPDAGGLVIATDQRSARAYARLLAEVSGEEPAVVLSDDPGSSDRIAEFAESEQRWLVAVRMVSEGVDVPRLAVGVYATATSTPLFFAQAVGRFVRARRRGELATVFLPTVPIVLAHAASLERQRDHVLRRTGDDGLLDEISQRVESEPTLDEDDGAFEALSSDATFDHVLFDGDTFGMHAAPLSQDEHEFLGLPGLLEPDQVSHLLADRQRRQQVRHQRLDRKEARAQGQPVTEVALYRSMAVLRKELNSLVAQHARVTGRPHSHVHAELRRQCGGPQLSQCTEEQLRARIDQVRRWR